MLEPSSRSSSPSVANTRTSRPATGPERRWRGFLTRPADFFSATSMPSFLAAATIFGMALSPNGDCEARAKALRTWFASSFPGSTSSGKWRLDRGVVLFSLSSSPPGSIYAKELSGRSFWSAADITARHSSSDQRSASAIKALLRLEALCGNIRRDDGGSGRYHFFSWYAATVKHAMVVWTKHYKVVEFVASTLSNTNNVAS